MHVEFRWESGTSYRRSRVMDRHAHTEQVEVSVDLARKIVRLAIEASKTPLPVRLADGRSAPVWSNVPYIWDDPALRAGDLEIQAWPAPHQQHNPLYPEDYGRGPGRRVAIVLACDAMPYVSTPLSQYELDRVLEQAKQE